MSQFYQVDSAKVSLREYWWGMRSPLVIIGWIIKWLRIRIPSSTDDANTDSTLPFVVPALPADIQSLFAPLTQQLEQLGFHEPVFHVIYDAGSSTTLHWTTFRHTSGAHLARIHHRAWGRSTKTKPVLFPMFITAFTDGTFLVSSSGKPDLATPATVQMIRKRGAKLESLWRTHEQKAQALAAGKTIKAAGSQEEVIAVCEELHILLRDFHLARGVFRPRTEVEQSKAQVTAAKVAEAQASGYENAEVLVELDRLQNKKASKTMVIWVLILSLAGFVALGTANWSWTITLWLIPVLLFHEAGHWVAMRIFKYRNLRMFFIPMFGAGVMGHHWNVPGWKKALVSLAGPIPGIIVGLGLGIAAMILHNPWMNKAALMLLLLNGMNLLPIFPMDGGHVLQATIFCRNRWLEAVFRLLAIGGLLLLGVDGRAFLYLGIALAVSLPITFKLAKVKEDLSKRDLPQPAPGEDSIPMPTAQAIIQGVKAAFGNKMRLSNKTVAQHSLNVFESLNAKPPGVLATLGLLGIQGGGLFIAVVMGLLLAFTGQNTFKDFARAAARQPLDSVSPGTSQRWGAAPGESGSRHLIVTHFKKEAMAAAAFQELTNKIPEKSDLTLYGQSVLLGIPVGDEALREKWFDLMQARSTNLFVRVSNSPVALSLTFIAPTSSEASNITQEVGAYLNASTWMHLIPPWSPDAHTPSYGQYQKSREAWKKIDTELSRIYTNADYKAYNAKMTAAMKRGSMGELKKLGEEQQEKGKELRTRALEQLSTDRSKGVSPELVTLFTRLGALSFTNRLERQKVYREVAAKLGEVRYVDDKPDTVANSYTASGGTITMHGLLCEVSYANFADPRGMVIFTKWLNDKGCRGFKSHLQGGWMTSEDFGDDLDGL